MSKWIGTGLLYFIGAIGVGFTVWRTYDLLSLTIAAVPNPGPKELVMPWLGVAMFDAGTIMWLVVFLTRAEGGGQRATSLVTSALDLILVIAATGFDLFLGGQTIAEIPADTGNLALWTVIAAVAINVIALWLYHILDPEALDASADKDTADELKSAVYKHIKKNRKTLAAQMAPKIAAELLQRSLQEAGAAMRGTNSHAPEQAFGVEPVSEVSLLEKLSQAFRGADNGGAQTTHAAEVPAVPNPTLPR